MPSPNLFKFENLNPDKKLEGIQNNLEYLINQITEHDPRSVDIAKYLHRMLASSENLHDSKSEITKVGFDRIKEKLDGLRKLIPENAFQKLEIDKDIETIENNLRDCLPTHYEEQGTTPRPS